MKIIVWTLIALLFVGVGSLYAGLGWVVAWILDKGLSVNVNYEIFVWVGVGIFLIKAIPYILIKLWISQKTRQIDKEFESWKLIRYGKR
jgi:hypothetical protein